AQGGDRRQEGRRLGGGGREQGEREAPRAGGRGGPRGLDAPRLGEPARDGNRVRAPAGRAHRGGRSPGAVGGPPGRRGGRPGSLDGRARGGAGASLSPGGQVFPGDHEAVLEKTKPPGAPRQRNPVPRLEGMATPTGSPGRFFVCEEGGTGLGRIDDG